MSNLITENSAILAVMRYEKKKERIHIPELSIKGCGYDLVTQDSKNKKRYIEIKSTAKNCLDWRWLEQSEFDAMSKLENYWVYAVINADTDRPKIRTFSQDEMNKRYKRDEIKRIYKFSKSDFDSAEEI